MIKNKILYFIGLDSWSRPVYKDDNGKYWKDIDNRKAWLGYKNENICNACNNEYEGEPDMPMSNNIDIIFIPKRIIE
ncbi:hypothetical protein JY742_10185 [Clostridioides difficile]|nr:hypothetical protein [Clostridioides difficile]